jgi:hypothetical protein
MSGEPSKSSQPSESVPDESALVRPSVPGTAFVIGIALLAVAGGSIAVLLLFTKPLAFYLAGLGLAASVSGLLSLIYGNWQRIHLIQELTLRAEELIASLDRGSPNRAVGYGILRQLADYRDALLRLTVYDQASRISEYITRYASQYEFSILEFEDH